MKNIRPECCNVFITFHVVSDLVHLTLFLNSEATKHMYQMGSRSLATMFFDVNNILDCLSNIFCN